MLASSKKVKDFGLCLILLLVGLFFVMVIPPFQKSDEVFHYRNVLTVVGRTRALLSGKQGWVVYNEEYELNKVLMSDLVTSGTHVKFPTSLYKKYFFYRNQSLINFKQRLDLTMVLQYLPAALGYSLAFGYPLIGYFFARLFSLFFFYVCLYFSYLILSKTRYRSLILTPLLLPMLWHQVAGISYDSTFISLLLLMTAMFIKINLIEKSSRLERVLMVVLVVLVSLAKVGGDIFLFLLLLVPWNQGRMGSWFRSKVLPKVLIVAFISAIFMVRRSPLAIVASRVSDRVQAKNTLFTNSEVNKLIIFSDHSYVARLLANTLQVKSEFYMKSFIGQFGWLDVELDWWVYPIILLMLSYFFIYSLSKVKKASLSWIKIIFLALILIGYTAMIFLGMYLWWTPVAMDYIEGVQGRYFIPGFFLFLFWLSELILKTGRLRVRKVALVLSALVILMSIFSATYKRYYDYSRLYQNSEDLRKDYSRLVKEKEIFNVINLNKETIVSLPTFDNKFAGFQLIVEPSKGVMIPLRYSLEDNLGRVLKRGYVNNDNIKSNFLQEEFSIKKVEGGEVTLKLTPVIEGEDENYLRLVESKRAAGTVLGTLLFISK